MSAKLRKGSRGPEVRALQESLNRLGYKLKADAHFGSKTDMAVRDFQRKAGLISDGVVSPEALKALTPKQHSFVKDIEAAVFAALKKTNDYYNHLNLSSFLPMFAQDVHKKSISAHLPPAPAPSLRTSYDGKRFIFTQETWKGRSNKLHFPGGESSGVTLGPGYDMGKRKSDEVRQLLVDIGVNSTIADKVAKEATGLKGDDAKKYAKENEELIELTTKQEYNLLLKILPGYEKIVHRGLTNFEVMQNQFDALVCVAYNPGRSMRMIFSHLINRHTDLAMAEILKRNKAAGQTLAGLKKRRQEEVNLYLNREYGKLRSVDDV